MYLQSSYYNGQLLFLDASNLWILLIIFLKLEKQPPRSSFIEQHRGLLYNYGNRKSVNASIFDEN